MAEIIHKHAQITSQVTETGTSFVTKLTITASDLTTAGFVANDDVVILGWVMVSQDNSSAHMNTRVTYDGTQLDGIQRTDLGTTTREKSYGLLYRVDLGGTVGDIDLDLAAPNGGTARIEKAEIVVMKLADFGTENTDWFWDKSTVSQTHTAIFVSTNQASITFTPASVEDWVIIGNVHHLINTLAADDSPQFQIRDSVLGVLAGPNEEEGADTAEERSMVMWDHTSLSAAEHIIENEIRDLTAASPHNVTDESRLFIFKADIFIDMFVDQPGSVSVAADTDVQVATITDTLSATMNVLMLGNGQMGGPAAGTAYYFWIEDVTTTIDPIVDFTSSLQAGLPFDTDDTISQYMMTFNGDQTAGALNLDLYFHKTDTGSDDLDDTKFLVWGLELAAGPAPPGGFPPRIRRPVYYPRRKRKQVFA